MNIADILKKIRTIELRSKGALVKLVYCNEFHNLPHMLHILHSANDLAKWAKPT